MHAGKKLAPAGIVIRDGTSQEDGCGDFARFIEGKCWILI
ncbi:hypothetical protein FTUN_8035 [Frigoriglobus tundricola]|uniref:Uncharacterized protein n=1 Tax=Frigoriglobus tundricola TaxID=2774151 RepID=A0A6M5Z3V3_9BACT|nr:hypothetical protein FTUN_8035 [Frigoriglobus tundricola]